MMKLKIKNNEYKVKFGYNCFCDTDIMDRVQDLMSLFQQNGAEDDEDIKSIGKIKELFSVVRELLYLGFQKYNPVETATEVGNLLDDYREEGEGTGEDRGLFSLFTELAEELLNQGFLSDLLTEASEKKNGVKAPTDHKKAKK